MKLIRYWDRFWFEPRETLTIGVIRALCGFLLLSWALLMVGHVGEWFTNDGLVHVETAKTFDGTPAHLSLLFIWPGRIGVYTIFAIFIASAVLVMLGLFSRWSCILAFVCLLSFDHRNLVILNSGDTLLKMLIFYLCMAPTDASFSLDSLLRRRSGQERPSFLSGLLNGLTFTPEGPMAAPWAQRLIQCQISLIYICTVLDKLPGHAWINGTALWYVYNLSELQRFPFPPILHTTLYVNLATWMTLVTEGSMGVLVWFPSTRRIALLLGATLHTGIEYTMNVPLFSSIILTCYLSFLDLTVLRNRFLLTSWGRSLAARFHQENSSHSASENRNRATEGRTGNGGRARNPYGARQRD